ncbi:hypothetical protein BJX99DRAFT_226669 [Aspergillus californicus]
MSPIRNVVIAGVSGNLGPALLSALASTPTFTVTVFTRADSSPTLPPNVKSIAVDYDSIENLTSTLRTRNTDAVISALPGPAAKQQVNLIHASVAANVSRFLPSEFGSDLDNADNRAASVYAPKVAAQDLLKALAAEGKITYTIVYNGAFLDWGLKAGFPIDPVKKRAALHDGGERLYSTTTLGAVGKAVVSILSQPEETKNRVIRVGEVVTTLKEVLALSQEVVGAEGWSITTPDTVEGVEKAMVKIRQGVFTHETIMPFIFKAIWGPVNDGHFKETDNELLGIKELDKADLKKIIQGVVEGN